MAQTIVDRRDVDFVLHEQLGVDTLSKHEKFADFNRKTIDLIVSEARNFAIKEMAPASKIGDEEGCRFENGKVSVPGAFQRVWELFAEGEWIAPTDDPESGGQGMPHTVALAARNYFHGANFPFMMIVLLSHGAGKLVEKFGTDLQKKLFLKKMYGGEWGGSMMLTEAEAGSDVGALTTTAVKNEDGTYSISGSKLFITAGDQDLTDNIIHPVLARIEGAPAGTAGISLFLAPKIWVNDDGSLGEPNDIVCTGIEEKMGIHGSPTCSMTLGGKGQCRGMLLGEANKGMRAMFVMMNEARLDVGMQGVACASASYLNALNYARERVQGRSLDAKSKDAPGVPIINHPDVRRMLMNMKVYSEAGRSLLFFIGHCEDLCRVSDDPEEQARLQQLIGVLIPIAKGYITDRAFDVCSLGVQVYGGYGYTREYPQEQYLRDLKITHIYEGSNGIQSMDLVGRKLAMDKGAGYDHMLDQIRKTVADAKAISALAPLADDLAATLEKLKATADSIRSLAMSEKMLDAYCHSYAFMNATGDAVMAWMLLWRAAVAAQKLEKGGKKKDKAFYEGQIAGARFFIRTLLPKAHGEMAAIQKADGVAMEIADEAFGGK
ncbi:acyl-CoA dehydrogenase [Desulfosarcina ovata]|uniref:Acyl-CoA dehydrogenase n=1 Tax=Desulfosarcina ovata subsp. ovata TaxID=2752305 RepID=A0A5K8AJ99_9BACT|nr:acyl-CoA dehydrogenase [Desulfosarcina ovata]BBO92775.1 acyl-CoA dehydrogenase [Desulfosarcina ovata subsp. ovata]